MNVSLDGVRNGQRTAAIVTPDARIDAGGFLVVYVRLTDVRNGAIHLAVSVNGDEVERVTIPTLVPDRYAFDPDDLEAEIARFAKK